MKPHLNILDILIVEHLDSKVQIHVLGWLDAPLLHRYLTVLGQRNLQVLRKLSPHGHRTQPAQIQLVRELIQVLRVHGLVLVNHRKDQVDQMRPEVKVLGARGTEGVRIHASHLEMFTNKRFFMLLFYELYYFIWM